MPPIALKETIVKLHIKRQEETISYDTKVTKIFPSFFDNYVFLIIKTLKTISSILFPTTHIIYEFPLA